jgi:hypothetical protein
VQGFGTLLSSNWIIVAAANVGGVVSLCLLIIVAFKKAKALLKDVWATSIAKTIQSRKAQYRRRTVECSTDLHIYMAYIVTHSVYVLLLTFPLLIFGLLPSLMQSFVPHKTTASPVIFYILTAISFVTNITAVALLADLVSLSVEVRIFRSHQRMRHGSLDLE